MNNDQIFYARKNLIPIIVLVAVSTVINIIFFFLKASSPLLVLVLMLVFIIVVFKYKMVYVKLTNNHLSIKPTLLSQIFTVPFEQIERIEQQSGKLIIFTNICISGKQKFIIYLNGMKKDEEKKLLVALSPLLNKFAQ